MRPVAWGFSHLMLRWTRTSLIWISLSLLAGAPVAAASTVAPRWAPLLPGLEHASIPSTVQADGVRSVPLEVLRVDLGRLDLRVVDARNLPGATAKDGPALATVAEMRSQTGALAVLNGGFFDEGKRPMGLVVTDGTEQNPLRRSDWGIFALTAAGPRIVHTRDAHEIAGATQALQCGPRLVVQGAPTQLKPQLAPRSVVCVDDQQRVLLLATQSFAEANALAAQLVALGCRDALNLDGGPSTQLSVAAGALRLEMEGGWPMPNGIGVFPKAARTP